VLLSFALVSVMTLLQHGTALLLLASVIVGGSTAEGQSGTVEAVAGADDPSLVEGSFRVDRGDQPPIWVPPGEVLTFGVDVDLGILGEASVGTVTMSSGVEPYISGLPLPGQKIEGGGRMVAWIRCVARGGHLGYELDHEIAVRFLPQEWPHILNTEVQTGSENRKRELKIGLVDGKRTGSYRSDGHCPGCDRREHFVKATLPWNDDYHCEGCKRGEHRVWSPPHVREVPEHTVDVLGAVYLARTMVREALPELELAMLQKEDVWLILLTTGELQEIDVPAGVFRCREVRLTVSRPPEEEDKGEAKFSGLFGIKGALKIWVQEGTGVPVLIEGDVPLGNIIDLHARVKLTGFLGTPESFVKVR